MLSAVSNLMTGVFGSRNQRLLKRYGSHVAAAGALEPGLKTLSDEALRAKTFELKQRYAAEKDLDALLPEAFALVREAAVRTLKMRHFDVQLIGGIALHQGKIAEMRTGEGKTLVATLAAYLNALTGTGVHIVTVNEYLAQRDADWMGPIYRFLGLEVGVIKSNQPQDEKRLAYDRPEIRRWLELFCKRFFAFAQFKRSALPNGPKVSAGGSLSPRGDWRAPSDGSADAWLRDLGRWTVT